MSPIKLSKTQLLIYKEGGDIGLFITPVPVQSCKTLGTFIEFCFFGFNLEVSKLFNQ